MVDSYTRNAMRLFSGVSQTLLPYFAYLKSDLKRSRIRLSTSEFLSRGIFLSFLIFLIELPILSLVLGFILQNFLFGFITSFTASFFILSIFFLSYVNYPKLIIRNKANDIDNDLPFASLHLSTITSAKLPLNKTLEIFSKMAYGEFSEEMKRIDTDVRIFGFDVNTALERAIERTPSKNMKELLWGMLSTNRSGGDMNQFLKEKSKSLVAEYRRRLYEFAHSLTIYIEIYLTSIVLGAVFFVILTAIMSGITGGTSSVLFLQFFLIFIFMPILSVAFLYIIKSSSPGGGE